MAIKTRTSGIMIPAYVAPVGGAYEGPGDVLGDAISWWGLRAFKASMIGNAAIKLRRPDTTQADIFTTTGGGLDLTNPFFTGGPYNVVRWYDQSGNGSHLSNAVPGFEPVFTLSGLGSFPVVTFTGATPTYLDSELNPPNTSQPYSYAAIVKNNSGGATYEYLLWNFGGGQFNANPPTTIYYVDVTDAGAFQTATLDNFHAVEGLMNGVNSFVMVDGSAGSTGPVGAGGTINNPWQLGTNTNDAGHAFNGAVCEIGCWAGDKSALFASEDSKARQFYGLP